MDYRSGSSYHAEDNGYYGNHQQNMDNAAGVKSSEKRNSPNNYKNHRD